MKNQNHTATFKILILVVRKVYKLHVLSNNQTPNIPLIYKGLLISLPHCIVYPVQDCRLIWPKHAVPNCPINRRV